VSCLLWTANAFYDTLLIMTRIICKKYECQTVLAWRKWIAFTNQEPYEMGPRWRSLWRSPNPLVGLILPPWRIRLLDVGIYGTSVVSPLPNTKTNSCLWLCDRSSVVVKLVCPASTRTTRSTSPVPTKWTTGCQADLTMWDIGCWCPLDELTYVDECWDNIIFREYVQVRKVTVVLTVDQELKEKKVGHLGLDRLVLKETLDCPVHLEVLDVTVCDVYSVFRYLGTC